MSCTHDNQISQKAQALGMGEIGPGLNTISFRDELIYRQNGLQEAADRNIEGANAIGRLLEYMDANPDAAELLEQVNKLARI